MKQYSRMRCHGGLLEAFTVQNRAVAGRAIDDVLKLFVQSADDRDTSKFRSGAPESSVWCFVCKIPERGHTPQRRQLAIDLVATLDTASVLCPAMESGCNTSVFPTSQPDQRTSSSQRNIPIQQRRQQDALSPPSTPPNPTRRLRKENVKGKQHEQPLPQYQQHHHQHQLHQLTAGARHSHGLSWSSTTRDSVVDNLLLSLDSLSSGGGADPDDDFSFDRERLRMRMPSIPQLPDYQPIAFEPPTSVLARPRGHTYSSSLSSEYIPCRSSPGQESPASFYSTPKRKGHRSNSDSAFDPDGRRINMPPRDNGVGKTRRDTQRLVRHPSSDDDGADYTQFQHSNRLAAGNRKSVSMDHIYSEALAVSVLSHGRPAPSVNSVFEAPLDAAPEPVVPAGPRKLQNPTATGPVYVNAASPKQSSLRKTTTQSDLRGQQKHTQRIREQASDFVRANSMLGPPEMVKPHAEPMPSPRFPSGSSGVGQPKETPSVRDRPGFFKRVFGGGSSRAVSGVSERSVDSMDLSERARPPSSRTKAQASATLPRAKSESRQSSSDPVPPKSSHASQGPHPPPTLNKKPSSFFRRRKKSTSESLAPPPLPLNDPNKLTHVAAVNGIQPAQPSPSISSLRKALDPFLATGDDAKPSRPATGSTAENPEDPDLFHSGYNPLSDNSFAKRDLVSRQSQAGDQPASPSKMKIKKRAPDSISTITAVQPDLLHEGSRSNSTATIEQTKVSPLSADTPFLLREKESRGPVSPASSNNVSPTPVHRTLSGERENVRNFSAGTSIDLNLGNNDGWSGGWPSSLPRPDSETSERQAIDTPKDRQASLTPSLQSGPAGSSRVQSPVSPDSHYHSATSLPLPSVQVEGNEIRKSSDLIGLPLSLPLPLLLPLTLPSSLVDEGAEYMERARKIFEGDEEDVTKAEAASWLGERNSLSTRTLEAYMRLFDLSGLNLLATLRALCDKLLLRGETQQFDRIITALSARWCECNPNHGFKAQDVVHTIFYSLVLLNTDLHLADIGEKMSRPAYVKNTLPTIRRVVTDAAPDAFDDTVKPGGLQPRPTLPWMDSNSSSPTSPVLSAADASADSTYGEVLKPNASKRLSIRPGMMRAESDGLMPDGSASNALVNGQWTGSMKAWEMEIENVLKSFFSSIRSEPLPLTAEAVADRNLTVAHAASIKRSGSVISRTPSDNMSQYRGGGAKPSLRTLTMNWQNRNVRSRPKIYPASTLGSSSRTSFDDNNSIWSPANSSSWSKNSYAKTLTSASVGSFQHFTPSGNVDFKHSIGFANALSQAIIREESVTNAVGDSESSIPGSLLDDEALTLEGAPWAKEGLVKHKHHLETGDRKAKERSWNDCFAVISKGKLTLFAFGTSSTKAHSMGRKMGAKNITGRAASVASTRVGGGDWMENAEQLDVLILRQTIASTLPPPGYSKARPHVWALSLPSGAVHLFQVGTPEIAKEFMTTANYWSARLSKEPLSGSVSNVEYGWSDSVINPALVAENTNRSERMVMSPPPSIQNTQPRHKHSTSGSMPRQSTQSSLRSSFDTGSVGQKARLPGDKAQISEWQPPTQSMMASQLLEVDQLRGLQAYVNGVEDELAKHNELKHAIAVVYSPRHYNYSRAMGNWQRKSDYLLREIVKFSTYIESLGTAQEAKDKFYARKAELDAAMASKRPFTAAEGK